MNPYISILQLLALYGFAAIVGGSRITSPIRNAVAGAAHWLESDDSNDAAHLLGHVIAFLLELVECPQCLGFWEGLALGLLKGEDWLGIAMMACLVSGANLLLDQVVNVGTGMYLTGKAAVSDLEHRGEA